MEKARSSADFYRLKAYLLLAKPGIIMGNAITATAGFALASKGRFDPGLFLATLAGLSLIIGSACVFNNYIDRNVDLKMERTKARALAIGVISVERALFFAVCLLLSGIAVLMVATNLLSVSIALFGFFSYVLLYSFSKYRTIHGTLIGSLSGSVPPVVGYVAVSGQLDLTALTFFTMMVLWQMPHFFAIAIYRLKDYASAGIPVLPVKKGVHAAKIQMMLYIIGFIAVSMLLAWVGEMGILYLLTATALGLGWLWFSIIGFQSGNDRQWARKMFVASLVVIIGLSAAIFFSA